MDRFTEMAVFVCIAQEGSFSAASRKMALSPSTVSKIVTRLEDRLGVKLFQRVSRATSLTVEGEAFQKSAERALAALADAECAATSSMAAPSGLLRVRTVPTFATHQLAPHIDEFLTRNPNIKLEIVISASPDFSDASADVFIAVGPLQDSSMIAHRIMRTRWLICASPGYIQKFGSPRTLGDLARHRCVNFRRGASWRSWSEHDSMDNVLEALTQPSVLVTQGDMILALARQNVGVVRLAEYQVAEDLKQGRLVRVLEDIAPEESTVYALFEGRKHLNPRIRAFLSFLEEKFAQEETR